MRRDGRIAFNSAAYALLPKGAKKGQLGYPHCQFWYDAETRHLEIKFVPAETEHSVQVILHEAVKESETPQMDVNAVSFINFYDLRPVKSVMVPVSWVETRRVLVCNLPKYETMKDPRQKK
jgi:hypothetical protein